MLNVVQHMCVHYITKLTRKPS